MVFDRDVELSNPAADPDQLASLAAWTKEDGGKLVQPEQFADLLDELAAQLPRFRRAANQVETRQHPRRRLAPLPAPHRPADVGMVF